MRDRLAGTMLRALLTNHAKIPDAEFDGPVSHQRQIRKNFAQPQPGAEIRMNQHTIASQLSQAGIDSQGDATGRIIGHRKAHNRDVARIESATSFMSKLNSPVIRKELKILEVFKALQIS